MEWWRTYADTAMSIVLSFPPELIERVADDGLTLSRILELGERYGRPEVELFYRFARMARAFLREPPDVRTIARGVRTFISSLPPRYREVFSKPNVRRWLTRLIAEAIAMIWGAEACRR